MRQILASVIFSLLLGLIFLQSAQAQNFYWEEEEILVEQGAAFSRTASGGGLSAVIWQDQVSATEDGGEFYLSMLSSYNGFDWTETSRFLGPFSYTGNQSYFFSFVIDRSGRIILAVSNDDNTVSIFISDDGDGRFYEIYKSDAFPVRVSPRMSLRSDGGLILFVTQESGQDAFGSLGIYYSVSDNGRLWSEYSPLAPERNLNGNFLPSHTSYRGRDYVAFQAFSLGTASTFQLYLKYSDDGGVSWSEPVYLSGFEDANEFFDGDPQVFDNQRPYILGTPEGLRLVWERGYSGGNPQIYYAELNYSGEISGQPEQVSRGAAECRNPKIVYYRGEEFVIWFDNRQGDYHNILAYKDGLFWNDSDLNYVTPGSSVFGDILLTGGDIYVMWENQFQNRSRLMLLSPDKTVNSPTLRAADFRAGYPAARDEFTIRWNSPDDSSGIAGYSYTYGRDPDKIPEQSLQMLDRNREVRINLDEDGLWYFHVIAQDYAGNWSEKATIEINRDTTPPGKVTFIEPETNEQDTLVSNTYTLRWNAPEEEDVAGYSYTLQYLTGWTYGGDTDNFNLRVPSAAASIEEELVSFRNIDNGLWALSVRAVDLVGNAGEPETLFFRLNKYIPVTYITSVDSDKDELGNISLEITGRGFAVGGLIKQVILDRDGQEPFDYIFREEDELYTVETDRFITGPVIGDIDSGTYRIGLVHPERGLYFTRSGIEIESTGTVKFGDFSAVPEPSWRVVEERRFNIPFKYILMALISGLLVFVFIFTLKRTASLVSEARMLQHQAVALIEGGPVSAEEKKKRVEKMSKIRMGLRFKFALLVTILVLLIVAMIAIPVAILTSDSQREILSSGLEDRAEVLLESITSGARTFLPSENILELSILPSQMSALGDDAVFVTITSEGDPAYDSYEPDMYDYVWVTNDPQIPVEAELNPGSYLMSDTIAGIVDELGESINVEAEARVGAIAEEIQRLNEQVEPLVERFIRTGNPEDEEAINQIQDELRMLDEELNSRLYEIGNQVASYPPYDSENLSSETTEYIFYKPVVYRSGSGNTYFHGLVRLGISTNGIREKIAESQKQLFLIITIIALGAIVLGIIGALILAAIIIRPINLLVKGVETIRDTEDKEELKSHTIKVKTHDELSLLADTVNQMTEGLVEAAAANKMLTVGKEVQKKFIPLIEDRSGNKLSTGREDNENISFFGYYEGAKGVSGDYFDFRKIDEVHYAAIKCDVAGKGVPASLIMVEVATIFLSFFRNRKVIKNKAGRALPPNIAELTYNINDLVEEVGFTGRFAAFTIVIVNSVTGDLYLCNAGDNLVHAYDSVQKKMVIKELPESPASGVFPSDMVRMGKGFVQIKDKMNQGDCLLLFTDGLEEAQRTFRDKDFNVIECSYKNMERGQLHDTHPVGNDNEELGVPRIQAAVNALMAGEKYSLFKYHNPLGDENLVFDFTGCSGTIEEAVMATIAVERVFRIYPSPTNSAEDRVLVDKAIVSFLKEHFENWSDYFSHPLPAKDEDQYITFTHLREDEQYDDLTILGIRKK